MFGKGNWAVFGVEPTQREAFEEALSKSSVMLGVSQFGASAVTRVAELDTVGINPFDKPRLDESYNPEVLTSQQFLDLKLKVAEFGVAEEETRGALYNSIPAAMFQFFAYGAHAFNIEGADGLFGFWLIENKWKDVTDLTSKREGLAYKRTDRPFKFLSTGEKKDIEAELQGEDAAQRKQYPVIIDFAGGRVYVECTNPKIIGSLQILLETLGVDSVSMAWKFGDSRWPVRFLNFVRENSHYKSEFKTRADEYKYHTAAQIEALEDAMLERVVSKYFATAQLETEQWASLGTPAIIEIVPTCPITVQQPPNATILLTHVDEKHIERSIQGSAVSFERVGSYFRKEEEHVFRKTNFTLTVDTDMNDLDAGVALLRGFDVPGFNRSLAAQIKAGATVSVGLFWQKWAFAMREAIAEFTENIRITLEIPREQTGGLVVFIPDPDAGDSEVKL